MTHAAQPATPCLQLGLLPRRCSHRQGRKITRIQARNEHSWPSLSFSKQTQVHGVKGCRVPQAGGPGSPRSSGWAQVLAGHLEHGRSFFMGNEDSTALTWASSSSSCELGCEEALRYMDALNSPKHSSILSKCSCS